MNEPFVFVREIGCVCLSFLVFLHLGAPLAISVGDRNAVCLLTSSTSLISFCASKQCEYIKDSELHYHTNVSNY